MQKERKCADADKLEIQVQCEYYCIIYGVVERRHYVSEDNEQIIILIYIFALNALTITAIVSRIWILNTKHLSSIHFLSHTNYITIFSLAYDNAYDSFFPIPKSLFSSQVQKILFNINK